MLSWMQKFMKFLLKFDEAEVTFRVRTVLAAARQSGRPDLVLGAFGCGAVGEAAGSVAAIFREQLRSVEFRGAFRRVVFAVLD